MIQNKTGEVLTFVIVIMLLAAFMLGIVAKENWTELNLYISSKINGKIDNPEKCLHLALDDTAYCLRDYVETFYNYTRRGEYPKSIEDIKENGGDCYDYTLLYEDLFDELGYNVKKVTIYGDDFGHIFNIVYDDELSQYCLVDQLNVKCYEIE